MIDSCEDVLLLALNRTRTDEVYGNELEGDGPHKGAVMRILTSCGTVTVAQMTLGNKSFDVFSIVRSRK